MKTRSVLLALSIFSILYSSCKKDDDNEPGTTYSSPTYDNYSRLAVGNYWVYQRYDLDTSGTYTRTIEDSCYINKDTVIGGNRYYVYNEPGVSGGMVTHFLRDSLHYILDNHKIIFSSQDHSSVFDSGYNIMTGNDTVCRYESKMTDINLVVNPPAGVFTTSAFITHYYMYPGHTNAGSTRYVYTRYAKNIGIVEQSLPFYANSSTYEIRQLIRYHLN
jgi:hypothetical protein